MSDKKDEILNLAPHQLLDQTGVVTVEIMEVVAVTTMVKGGGTITVYYDRKGKRIVAIKSPSPF